MKHIATALMLCAIPATGFTQDLSCNGCGHVAPYFRGSGGFIGTVADGVDQVTFVSFCGSVSTTGEAQVNGRTATQLFNQRNGLACDREGGSLEIAGLAGGGWYWITDDMNSAVGNLVAMGVLDNQTTELTSAGAGVTMSAGRGAVFVKETSTGRVGLLPNILPAPVADQLRKCGFDTGGTASNPTYSRRTSECAQGDGGTITLATTTNPYTGATTRVLDKASIVRPAGTASVDIIVDLWGNGSGHFTTAVDGDARLGQQSVALTAARGDTRLTGVTYTASLASGPTADPLTSGAAIGGIEFDTTTDNVAMVSISADLDYCSRTNNVSTTVSVTASMPETGRAQVTPALAAAPRTDDVGRIKFTVVCP